MPDHKLNRLAGLADVEREREQQHASLLLDRVKRIKRKIVAWDRDELADGYAWMLLLALVMRRTERVNDRWRKTYDEMLRLREIEVDVHREAMVEQARKLVRHHFDRKRGGDNRNARDPIQAAKAEALKLWIERDLGKHPKLGTVEQFAMECVRRWPVLKIGTIKKWSTEWTKLKRGQKGKTNPLAGARMC